MKKREPDSPQQCKVTVPKGLRLFQHCLSLTIPGASPPTQAQDPMSAPGAVIPCCSEATAGPNSSLPQPCPVLP